MRFLLINLPIHLLKGVLTLLVFLTPMLGVWFVSSLVAYTNGPTGLAVFSGILLFPLIPIIWDLKGRNRRRERPQILTWGDRIILRTLLLNLVFITCLLALRPQTAFLSLSTRGDWMLDGYHTPPAESVRQSLFKLANGLEWLYLSVHQNPYTQYAEARDTRIRPQPAPQPSISTNPRPPSPTQTPEGQAHGNSGQTGDRLWPWQNSQIHPAVATMPAQVETSIESVAQYIAQQETDPFLRIKALHDYVADRIAYDAPAYFGQIPRPPQDAETVFRSRKAVCAGYAKLLEALGQAIGEDIVYVVGDSRSQASDIEGGSHAWNAVQIQGNWYLLDATWDSGYLDASKFTRRYSTNYLLPPPDVMVMSHFPDEPSWQLLAQPLSRGEFFRQPMLRPQFFANGLTLISPTRSQTQVQGDAIIHLENPHQQWLIATYQAKGGQQQRCSEQNSQSPQLSCSFPSPGTYEVSLFSADEQDEPYDYLGHLEFNRS